MSDKYKLILEVFGRDIREYALEAKEKRDSAKGTEDEDYYNGYLMGYHRSVTLVQLLAESFNVPLKEINLDNFDANDELI